MCRYVGADAGVRAGREPAACTACTHCLQRSTQPGKHPPSLLPLPRAFPQGATKFASSLAEAAAGAGGGAELALPEPKLLAAVVGHRGPKSLTRAAADPSLVAAFSAALEGWCSTVEGALAEGELEGKDAEDAGGCWALGSVGWR